MLLITLFLQFQHSVVIFTLAYARLAIVIIMLPVLGERVLANLIIKNTVVILLVIGLWPVLQPALNPEQGWLLIFVKECLVGLVLAMTLCLPFWIVVALGELIDNQRGATLSDSIDPVHGGQSSVLSGFLSFAFGVIFFASGGMRILMTVLVSSYRAFPGGSPLTQINGSEVGQLLMTLAQGSIMLAAPIMMVLMLSEVILGIFARYCPQLNPFSLSLTIKSSIAFLLFLLYGFRALAEKPLSLFYSTDFQRFFQ